ncbi:hypothetical protein YPPY63_4330, partial [Yersinia pestis PY-63]
MCGGQRVNGKRGQQGGDRLPLPQCASGERNRPA